MEERLRVTNIIYAAYMNIKFYVVDEYVFNQEIIHILTMCKVELYILFIFV